MTNAFTNAAHRQYLDLLAHVGDRWLALFDGNTDFYSSHYWDLLTTLWEADEPVRKTDAIDCMKSVKSPHTAGKYIDTAVAGGIIVETGNPKDARSRLVALSPSMRDRMDGFFDAAVAELCASAERIAGMRKS